MTQVVKLPMSYFGDNDGNGNIALSTLRQRVDDASKMLVNGTVIELDNGVKCSTREELYRAIEQVANPSSYANLQPIEESVSKQKKEKDIKRLGIIGIAVIAIVFVTVLLIQINPPTPQNYNYTNLVKALDRGDVQTGMTMTEIMRLVGEADHVKYKDEYHPEVAFYYQKSHEVKKADKEDGTEKAHEIQLCFDNQGKLYKVNRH